MLALDFEQSDGVVFRLINIYAPPMSGQRKAFFLDMSTFVTNNTILAGDFNSVTDSIVVICGLSHTIILQLRQEKVGLTEFTLTVHCHAGTDMQVVSCSDHYLVGLFKLSNADNGPKQWKFAPDLLCKDDFNLQVKLILEGFNSKFAVDCWEQMKVKIQALSQQHMQFRQKQLSSEISGLKQSLSNVNARIFNGENLEADRVRLQD